MNRVTPFLLMKGVETSCEGLEKRTRRLSDMNALVQAYSLSDEGEELYDRR
jgi:hypothetical protein